MDVGVENGEGKEQHCQILLLALEIHFFKRAARLSQPHRQQIQRDERGPDTAREVVHAVHRAEELMLQRLHQKEAQQRHTKGEEKDTGGGQLTRLARPMGRTVFILSNGPRADLAGQETQQRDERRHHNGERHWVEEHLLDVERMVVRWVNLEPRMEVARPSKADDRQCQDEHPGKEQAGDRLGHPTNGGRPTGIKQMVRQGEEQRTHTQAQAKHVGREVAMSDLLEGKDGDSGVPMVGMTVVGRTVASRSVGHFLS